MKINNCIKIFGLSLALTAAPVLKTSPVFAKTDTTDVFVRTVPPEGCSEQSVLDNAPNPEITIKGEKKKAAIVVDLSNNILYKYDKSGTPEKAFLIASGKSSTPTNKGVRIVTHVEKFPYRTAPRHTKRRRNPHAYGPNIICLNKINITTGEQSQTGEFIHGTNEKTSLGKYVSHGCMRMDNEVIKQLSGEVKRGDIVIIK